MKNRVPNIIGDEQAFWSHPKAVSYYSTRRSSKGELYASEREFITDALFAMGSHLDVGCAAGGLAAVAQEANPAIQFTGVDVSPVMIATAKQRFPQYTFAVSNGRRIEAKDSSFASSSCLGVLHLAQAWEDILVEIWRVTSNIAVFDVRLADVSKTSPTETAYQTLAYAGAEPENAIPYAVISPEIFLQAIKRLQPAPLRIEVKGYMHAPGESSCVPLQEVCMTMCCLWKKPVSLGSSPFEKGILWDAPLGVQARGLL